MSIWTSRLDAAGIHDPRMRDDFTRQRAVVARYKRAAYAAVLLLLPRPLAPHVIAAVAFMHHTDNLLDQGPLPQRAAAYAAWEKEVNQALATGTSDHPVIRPLLHTGACHPRLLVHAKDFLRTATTELEFTGFATESDYQRYLDEYSLPAFLLVAGLLVPGDEPAGYRAACRTYIDGSQRLDFVNDLAEDLSDGRLTIPEDALLSHGVTRAGLVQAQDTPGARALLRHLLQQARAALAASHCVTGFLPPANRPFVRALIALEEATTDAAEAKGPGLLTAPARPAVSAMLKILLREYRHTRSLRRSGRVRSPRPE
ncbi:squalene/phytoene synthase family protein [Streptomyces sp. SID8375]|uniref:squalene/phytoene synthase family protein n=1 Tax=Streptomyces TaxID=1883 RepID=UPI00037196B5|nr:MULTISPECIES: squalene/phytoene synthase family protein [unclassified Streptomyces]MYX07800.1 squalene/phytoene synthase family protein [Streptomyces sp. SID8375]